MSNIPNIEEYKQKIYEKLVPSGWGRVFKSFIFSTEFENILLNLHSLSTSGHRFTPPLKDVFRAFEECPYDELKVVIVGQDPYPTLGVADGISFSCGKTMKEQPSLRYIFGAIEEDYPHRYERDCDLSRWSKQGILMLNTALTTEVGKIGQHYDIWAPFSAYLFDYLKNFNPGLVYVYMGKKSQEWSDLCGENCTKFTVPHPASAAYSGGKWNSQNIFRDVKETVYKLYNYSIHW
jgi:uracil-DNA glycosylase